MAKKKALKKAKVTASTDKNPQTLAANEQGITSEDQGQLVDNSGGYQGDPVSQGIENDATVNPEAGQEAQTEVPVKEECKCEETPQAETPAEPTQESGENTEAGTAPDEDEWSSADMTVEESTKFTGAAFTLVKNADKYSLLKIYVNPLGGEECRMEVVRENLDKEAAKELLKQYVAKDIFDKLA